MENEFEFELLSLESMAPEKIEMTLLDHGEVIRVIDVTKDFLLGEELEELYKSRDAEMSDMSISEHNSSSGHSVATEKAITVNDNGFVTRHSGISTKLYGLHYFYGSYKDYGISGGEELHTIYRITYIETRVIKEIADEMAIYMNHFDTEEYPANATNLKYMNNLFELMGKYRQAIEEELDAYRVQDEKDFFDSETYIKFKAIKEVIEDENTWVLSPNSTGNEDDPELGPTLASIDRVPILIHSEEEGLPFAKAYFDEAYGNVSLDEIEISGGGGSNIHGRMFINYDYKYGNEEVAFYETGDIEHIRYEYEEDLGSDESSWSEVTVENFEVAKGIAEEYLEKHGLDDYGLGSNNLGYSSGYINLRYSYSTVDDYYDDLNTVEFTFFNGPEVLLESIWYPRHLYRQVLDTSRFDEGYKKKSKFMDMLEPYYNIADVFYQNGPLEGNMQTYEWRFIVLEGIDRYFIVIDADTREVTGTYPVPKEWNMNGSD